jgi:hypothetical protein
MDLTLDARMVARVAVSSNYVFLKKRDYPPSVKKEIPIICLQGSVVPTKQNPRVQIEPNLMALMC